ncbi:MAG: hypothetical protein VKJ04_02190 [Vampirovibrionales bacterium]|nr:hypothetical protein [Vampirovibrionales bacterium]
MKSNSILCRCCAFLVLLTVALGGVQPANAWWFKKDKEKPPEIENFEPPSEDAFITQCDPIRQQVVNLNDKTPKYLRIFIVPRREYLQHKHRRCKARVMNQEFQYLKHVDIKNPTLPKIPSESELQAAPEKPSTTPEQVPETSEPEQAMPVTAPPLADPQPDTSPGAE